MTFSPDTTVLHYRIAEKLGEGGMGVVWRARDTTLDRDVAIKVLPEALAADAERLARFEREAKLLASLNHAHIAAVYGLHEHEGTRFIVMELVPGEDLAAVLQRGPLPSEQVLAIAKQIATALEVAHEQGVIHRDLKPANIKLTPEGEAKILDFGLAKALLPDPTASGSTSTMSPTLTSAGSIAGVILGTAAYMSPQQARGHAVDKRADIWSFGCVLYEMLTGKLAFPGETVSDTLAAVLKLEPDWSAIPGETPQALTRLTRRCLTKDARQRLRDVGEARIAIEIALSGEASEVPAVAQGTTTPGGRWVWAIAGLALILAAAGWLLPRGISDDAAAGATMRFQLDFPSVTGRDVPFAAAPFALSPDGEHLAYLRGRPPVIHIRRLDEQTGVPLSGTEGAGQLFFSPDGESLGYFADGELRRVPTRGGASTTLAAAPGSRGGSWTDDDSIIFTPSHDGGLFRIAADGGEPVALTDTKAENHRSHRWPQILPGGRAVLFTAQPIGSMFENAHIVAEEIGTGKRHIVHAGGSFGRYVPTGHVTFVHQSTLWAVPFDLDALEATGPPVPVLEDVLFDLRNGSAHLDFSPQGTLVYLSGSMANTARHSLIRVMPDNTVETLLSEPNNYLAPRFSPDDSQIALEYSIGTASNNVWSYDLKRGVTTRLTFRDVFDMGPAWTPDGQIVYSSVQDSSVPNLRRLRNDGSSESERLTESIYPQLVNDVSPDGKYTLFQAQESNVDWDLQLLDLSDGTTSEYLATEFIEQSGSFSRDGQWVAYESNETGRWEIFVRPFPASPGKWQISNAGGRKPVWSADGRSVFYQLDDDLLSVDVTPGKGSMRIGLPRVAFEDRLPSPARSRSFDVAADGSVVTYRVEELTDRADIRVYLVLNWFRELEDLGQ